MNYSEPCYYSTRLVEKLKSLDIENKLNLTWINKAIYWAKKYHGDARRKSGEPFYTHPLEVAYTVSDYNLKTEIIVASILHDIVEDTEVTVEMIFDAFGPRAAQIVDRLTRNRPDGTILRVEEILNNAYLNDDRDALLIKIMDRLHNLSTLSFLEEHRILDQINETCNSLFPGITATFFLDLEKRFFLALQKEDSNLIHKSAYNTLYNFPSDYSDFPLAHLKLNIE